MNAICKYSALKTCEKVCETMNQRREKYYFWREVMKQLLEKKGYLQKFNVVTN